MSATSLSSVRVGKYKFRVLLFFLIAFVFPFERKPKRVPFSDMATQA